MIMEMVCCLRISSLEVFREELVPILVWVYILYRQPGLGLLIIVCNTRVELLVSVSTVRVFSNMHLVKLEREKCESGNK